MLNMTLGWLPKPEKISSQKSISKQIIDLFLSCPPQDWATTS